MTVEFKLGKERGTGDRINDLKVLVISQGRCSGVIRSELERSEVREQRL